MIDDLYHKYGTPTAPEGHKHHRNGWVNIECPFCSDGNSSGYHLGFNTENAYFYCWRCGSHQVETVLMKLLRIPYNQAKDIADTYKLHRKGFVRPSFTPGIVKIKKKSFKFPSDVTDLKSPHKKYLINRGFDPQYLIDNWDIKGTGPTSTLDHINYKYRILIPILWNEKPVTFQARDYTGKQAIKYLACPEERETIHHKHILYGHPSLWQKRRGILVEGVFDVWRLRLSACCTFGTGYTTEQVRVMVKMFDELYILFDPEPVAQKRASELKEELSFWGVKTQLLMGVGSKKGILTDPGDMPQEDADHMLKELKML